MGYEEYEDYATIVDCDCPHDPEAHSWEECDWDDCSCKGHWEE